MITGHTGVVVFAGPLNPSRTAPNNILHMGETLTIHIEPDTARQWISILSTITEEKSSK